MNDLTPAKGDVFEDADFDEAWDNQDADSDPTDRLQQIKDAHVNDGLALRVTRAFAKLEKRAASPGLEGRGMLISGLSGTGKSHAWEQVTQREEFRSFETEFGIIRPALALSAPAPCTLKTLGLTIYEELTGVILRTGLEEHEIWSRVRAQLKAQKVKYLCIDEVQHILIGRNAVERRKVAETFKTITQMKEWPIYLVLAGMPEFLPFLRQNIQLNRRILKIEITPVQPGEPGDKAIVRYLELLTKHLDVEVDFEIADMATRFRLASSGYLGMCALLMKEAAILAYDEGPIVVTAQHLAEALTDVYAATGKEIDAATNPFLCPDLSNATQPKIEELGRDTLLVAKGRKGAKR